MKVPAYKKCDLCGKVIARKGFLFYHTVEDYMTVVEHEEAKYPDSSGTKSKWHYCIPCWLAISSAARKLLKEGIHE